MMIAGLDKEKMRDKYKIQRADGTIDSKHSDMFAINKRLMAGEKAKKLHMLRSNRTIEVDFTTGDIIVDSKKVSLKLKSKPKNFRWINFNRVYKGYGMTGQATESKVCVVGWQSTVNGRNVKRMVAVYPNGRAELWKENDEIISVL